MLRILEWILITASILSSLAYLYHAVIILLGRLKKKNNAKPEQEVTKQNRICVLICARNEEQVIGRLIDSLNEQDYPKDSYRICVVADNCTDSTAEVARTHGAKVYERFNNEKRGKGYALNYFFNMQESYYDAYCIFDADNVVDKGYLRAVNAHFNNGEVLIQGYRTPSNPTENAVSSCYAMYFSFIIKLYMASRQRIGLSCMVGGTGFAFSSELVKNGWNTQSMTEDAEFSIQTVLAGNSITLAEDAIFYDEQPTSFSDSISQRHRWTVGTMQLLKSYSKRLLTASTDAKSKKRSLICFDIVMFMVIAPLNALPIISTVLMPILLILLGFGLHKLLLFCLLSLIASYLYNMLLAYAVTKLIGFDLKQSWKGILFYPIFSISWSIISLVCCVSDKCVWKPIKHTGSNVMAVER